MLKKVFSVFCLFFSIGAFCVFGSAEEVEIVPNDDFTVLYFWQYGYPDQTSFTLNTRHSCPSVGQWFGGDFKTYDSLYNPDDELDNNNFNLYDQYLSCIREPINHGTAQNSYNVWLRDPWIDLDVSGYVPGWYRYEADIYLGLCFAPYFMQYSDYDLLTVNPSFTYVSDPVENNGLITQYYGLQQSRNHLNGFWAKGIDSGMVHIGVSYTFYLDGSDTVIGFAPDFSVISPLNYDMTTFKAVNNGNGYNGDTAFFANGRFTSTLYSNVEPPITPTPAPTPYPGQDTQESINAGVQLIVSDLNINATPIPTPADLTIDETVFDMLNDYTLPDVSDEDVVSTYSDLWSVFSPFWVFLGALFGSLLITSIFLYILRGGFV